ncbi:hypothetical protein HYX14_01025 [Candidatus Woesearchaeota archaeon]|nr:hypothetical protein [Candidatus Woesearchaeota archaeon]
MEKMPTYIIEHLEPKVYEWCFIEYKQISRIVGKKNLWITNTKNQTLNHYARVIPKSAAGLHLNNVCLLDPAAKKELTPEEARHFQYFVFGGILGDYPPRKRTEVELTQKFSQGTATRNVGKEQMSTDHAVAVVKEIVQGKKLSALKFQDQLEIHMKEGESMLLPYRYLLIKGKLLVSKELLEYLKKKKGF